MPTPLLAAIDEPGTRLARYDAMCRAIEAAHEVDEVKDIRDKALAWEVYSRQAKNIDAEHLACEIRLRAERKAGELLRQMEKASGKRTDLVGRVDQVDDRPTLSDLGVSKDQSSQWQKLADVPKPIFDGALEDRTQKPTTNGIIRAATPPEVTPVSDDALWLWGRLRDFDRHGLLGKDPGAVLKTMTPTMLDDVHTLAPRVAAWLKRIGAV